MKNLLILIPLALALSACTDGKISETGTGTTAQSGATNVPETKTPETDEAKTPETGTTQTGSASATASTPETQAPETAQTGAASTTVSTPETPSETPKVGEITAEQKIAIATCLKEKWAKLYGTEWCPHCKNQKKVLGKEALDVVGFIDCDEKKWTCQKAGIKGYPTWIIDGKQYPGSQKMERLAQLGQCSL